MESEEQQKKNLLISNCVPHLWSSVQIGTQNSCLILWNVYVQLANVLFCSLYFKS